MKNLFKNTIIFLIILTSTTSFSYSSENSIKDVPTSHWAYEPIIYMIENNIIDLYEDGSFQPEAPVTRAEYAKMLVLTLQMPLNKPSYNTFIDVSDDYWAYEYIETAIDLLTYYEDFPNAGDSSFFPDDFAEREDATVSAVEALNLGNETPDYSLISNLNDYNDISDGIKDYVAISLKHNLLLTENNSFMPRDYLTRAEACHLSFEILKKKTGVNPNHKKSFYYKDDFSSLNKNFWFAHEYKNINKDATSKLNFDFNSSVKIIQNNIENTPVLVSAPIKLNSGDIIIIKRRIYVHPENRFFKASSSLFESSNFENKLNTEFVENPIFSLSHINFEFDTNSVPIKNGYLFQSYDKSNHSIDLPLITDLWFEEKITYDTNTGVVTYDIAGQKSSFKSKPLTNDFVRFSTNSYGWGVGHFEKMDWIEFKVLSK